MEIYLVRHAIAEERDPAIWPDDRLRPLTEKGRERFEQAARGLSTLVPRVDAVLSSPFVRAWDTAEILAAETGWPAPERLDTLASGASAAEIVNALRQRLAAESLVLVGHEPDLSGLLAYLAGGSELAVTTEFRKGGAAWLSLEGPPGPGMAELRWLLPPKVLRAIAPE